MDSLISTFHIDIKLLIAQIVNFAIVFAILYIFSIKPLTKMMNNRTNKIEKGIADAKKNAEQLEKTGQDYKDMLTKGRIEAQEIVKKANIDAENKRQELISKAKEDVNNLVLEGKAQLSAQKMEMVKEAKAEIIEIISQSTKKVLDNTIDVHLDEEIISNSIKDIKNG